MDSRSIRFGRRLLAKAGDGKQNPEGKELVEPLLDKNSYVLNTCVFELTPEAQRLLVALLIANARKMEVDEKAVANATLAIFLSGAENQVAIVNDCVH